MAVRRRCAYLEIRLGRQESAPLLQDLARIPTVNFRIVRGRMTTEEVWMVLRIQGAPPELARAVQLARSASDAVASPVA